MCMAQVIGALNLAAGLRDACLAHSPVIAFTGGRDAEDQVPQGLPGGRRRAGLRAGDQVQRHDRCGRAHSRHGAPGFSRRRLRLARPGAPAVPRQRGPDRRRGSGHGAAVRAAVRARAAVPPASRIEAACAPRSKCCKQAERPVIVAGGGVRASGAGRELVALAETLQIPVATSLNGKDAIPGSHPLSVGVVGSYSRESANRVVGAGRSRLLRRHRDRRHDDAFLGGAEDRRAGDPDRHRSGGARPQLPAQGGRAWRCQAALARMLRADQGATRRRRNWVERSAGGICREWLREISRRCSSRTRCQCVPSACAPSSPGTCRRTPSSSSTPAMPACGWAACTTCASPRQSYMRSAGHLGWAFPAGLGAKCARARAAGGRVHRRRRLLVPHRRDRDRGALEDEQP